MQRLICSQTNSEVLGIAMVAFLEALSPDVAHQLLLNHGLDPNGISGDVWYPLQTLLDMYRAVGTNEYNVTEDYVSLGMKITDAAPFPPNMPTLEVALHSLGETYRLAHRNVTERGWSAEMMGEREALVTADNPYPDDLCYGLLWALVRRHAPKGSSFQIIPQPLDDPHDPLLFRVTW